LYDPHDPHRHLYDIDDGLFVLDRIFITGLNFLPLRIDHYHISGSVSYLFTSADPRLMSHRYNVTARTVTSFPRAQSTLINGKGRYTNGPAVPLTVINVLSGMRYRFRIIAMSCDTSFFFSVDGHTLTVIEADGENTVPLVVDSLQIFAGARYSAVLEANQPVGNYWIRANTEARASPGFDGGRNSAILRYAGAPVADPTTSQTPNERPLKETDLHPLTDLVVPGLPVVGGADVVLTLDVAYDTQADTFTFNGGVFKPPTLPVLLQILSGAQSAQDLLPSGTVYTLPRNKVIEINIPGLLPSTGGPVSSG